MLDAMWQVLLALAPWLLLGMIIAGLLHVLLPTNFVRRQLTGRAGVIKAVALGVPLPLCSCGVIPAGLGLKKDGASNGAAVGFLISTPQTGVDSLLVSSSFLGWPFALFKLLSAAVTGLVGGWLTDAVADSPVEARPTDRPESAGARGGFRDAVDHAMEILRTIWRWVVFGVVVSAAIEVFVPQGLLTGLSEFGTMVPILAALAISLPLYVCATASVPIAAALVAGGMPAGAAIVFLMAGPATNVATIGAISRTLGRKALVVYLSTIILGSIVAGIVFDFVLDAGALTLPHAHERTPWWALGSAVVLLLMIGWFAVEDLLRLAARLRPRGEAAAIEIGVSGMTCGGCASKLERALRAESGVTSAVVSLEPGKVVVQGAVDEMRVRQVVENAGFKAAPWNGAAPSQA